MDGFTFYFTLQLGIKSQQGLGDDVFHLKQNTSHVRVSNVYSANNCS
jgi:hypothetical protein